RSDSTDNHPRQRPARLSIDGRTRLGHSLERCIRITGECLASLIQVPEGFPRLLTRPALTAHPPRNSRQGLHQCGPVLQELLIAPCERNSGQGIWHTPQANGVCLRVVDNSLPVDGHTLQHSRLLCGRVTQGGVPLRLLDVVPFNSPLIVVAAIEPDLFLILRVSDLVSDLERINRSHLDKARLRVSEC